MVNRKATTIRTSRITKNVDLPRESLTKGKRNALRNDTILVIPVAFPIDEDLNFVGRSSIA